MSGGTEVDATTDDLTGRWTSFADARWFSGKGRGGRCTGVTPLDWFDEGGGPVRVRSEIATIAYPDGHREDYQLLVSYRREPLPGAAIGGPATAAGLPHDALRDPEALALLVAAVAKQAEHRSWSSVVRRPGRLEGPVRVFGGEQSNTSLLVGSSSILKLFRKLEHGHNLDIAVHDALDRAGVDVAAHLYGWVEGRVAPADGEPYRTDLAMVVEQLQEAKDGWELALRSAADDADFGPAARSLGRALAQVHQALADTFPAARIDGTTVADAMDRRLEAAVGVTPQLEPHAPALRNLFAALRGHELNAQQVHGDFHLGQTLLTPGGWRIIDFEGEPMKTLTERREPDSKWRDVAGMIRSFGYATSGAADPGSAAARGWYDRAVTGFMAGYGAHLTDVQRLVLDSYIADKAVYEVVYEARNRPTWVDIPLGAIAQLTEMRN